MQECSLERFVEVVCRLACRPDKQQADATTKTFMVSRSFLFTVLDDQVQARVTHGDDTFRTFCLPRSITCAQLGDAVRQIITFTWKESRTWEGKPVFYNFPMEVELLAPAHFVFGGTNARPVCVRGYNELGTIVERVQTTPPTQQTMADTPPPANAAAARVEQLPFHHSALQIDQQQCELLPDVVVGNIQFPPLNYSFRVDGPYTESIHYDGGGKRWIKRD